MSKYELKKLIMKEISKFVDEEVLFGEPTGIPGLQPQKKKALPYKNTQLSQLANFANDEDMMPTQQVASSGCGCDYSCTTCSGGNNCECNSCSGCEEQADGASLSVYDSAGELGAFNIEDDMHDIVISLSNLSMPKIKDSRQPTRY
tara:strand:+ start:313 stop:750 length:438 start_codon:yes stop_codon:yes gene_type:complete